MNKQAVHIASVEICKPVEATDIFITAQVGASQSCAVDENGEQIMLKNILGSGHGFNVLDQNNWRGRSNARPRTITRTTSTAE